MREYEQPLLHPERAWEMRKHYGLARARGQRNNHAPFTGFVRLPHADQRFGLIRTQIKHDTYDPALTQYIQPRILSGTWRQSDQFPNSQFSILIRGSGRDAAARGLDRSRHNAPLF